MESGFVAETPVFASGIVLGAVLLCLGLATGFWFGRRSPLAFGKESLDGFHLANLLQGLSQWTNGFASDVSQYRADLDRLCHRLHSVEQGSSGEQEATLVGLLSQIVNVNEQLRQRLDNAEGTLQDQAKEITAYMSEARTDTLTGLANRRVFDSELARRIGEGRRSGVPFSVLLVDVDHFKRFNDRHGHLAGDAVLAGVARTLQESMREADLVARIGGEEFAVILPGLTTESAVVSAENARRAVERAALHYEGKAMHVTVSCGTAQLQKGEEMSSLVKRADEALYASKAAGRNMTHWQDGFRSRCVATHGTRGVPEERTAAASPEFGEVCDELRKRLLALVAEDA